jgi:hypothetical protein
MTTDTIIAKIQLRRGQLDDLPVLDEAELGYATDYNRLFIGNKPVTFKGDGVTTRFSIKDAEIIPNQIRVLVGNVEAYYDASGAIINSEAPHQTPGLVYTTAGTDLVFAEPPEYDIDITVSFNSEVKVFRSNQEKSLARLDSNTAYSKTSINWELLSFNTAKLSYSYKTASAMAVGEAYFIINRDTQVINVLNNATQSDIQFQGEIDNGRFYITYRNPGASGNLFYSLELWNTI